MNCVYIICHKFLITLNRFLKNLDNEKNMKDRSPDELRASKYSNAFQFILGGQIKLPVDELK